MRIQEKQVTFYPSYGYESDDQWVIPMRLWVREPSDFPLQLLSKLIRRLLRNKAGLESLTFEQKHRFQQRAEAFIADRESRERVIFVFDNDPDQQPFIVINSEGGSTTDFNGLLQGQLILGAQKAQELLQYQGSDDGWLTFRAVSNKHQGIGRIRLIGQEGLSIISDIDDTVKITGFTEGTESVLRNTFFEPFKAPPHMPEMYRAFEKDTAFHYVSGSPWQLYVPLSTFLFSSPIHYPLGSVHMKNARTNLLESESYQDIWKLVVGGTGQATIDQKIRQISHLMQHFPRRHFILIGDSGEHDPEIFNQIRQLYPSQVQEIMIRDVAGDIHTGRLENMTVLEAH